MDEINAALAAGAQGVGDREEAVRKAGAELEGVSRQLAELKKARDEVRGGG